MKKSAFIMFALCILVLSSCKKDYTCNCTYTYSLNQVYTGTNSNPNTTQKTKDTSYTNTTETSAEMFQGASKGKISANGHCNSYTNTITQFLVASYSSSSNISTYYNVPVGQVNVGTYTEIYTANCSFSK